MSGQWVLVLFVVCYLKFGVAFQATPQTRWSRPGLSVMNADTNSEGTGMPKSLDFKLVTYNILAPCYKKDSTGVVESTQPLAYIGRNREICSMLLDQKADIICLQEFWAADEALRGIYCDTLRKQGYSHREVRRTSHWRTRKDGLACFVKDERIILQDSRDIYFHDAGDRVAQLLLLAIQDDQSKLKSEGGGGGVPSPPPLPPQQFLLVHTHLLFPHNEFSSKIRMREMTKILGFIESYRQRELCDSVCGRSDVRVPVIITGDLNGSPRGKVYQFICSQNYKSAMQESWQHESGGDEKWAKWISHRNHRAQLAPVDHVFFLNPQDQTAEKLPPVPDWTNLVFREVLERIRERQDIYQDESRQGGSSAASNLTLRRAFEDFDEDNSQYVTREEFEASLLDLGFGHEGEPALTPEEIDLLVVTADKNGDGKIDFGEFCDRFERAIVCNDEDEDCVPFSRSTWLVEDLSAGSAQRRGLVQGQGQATMQNSGDSGGGDGGYTDVNDDDDDEKFKAMLTKNQAWSGEQRNIISSQPAARSLQAQAVTFSENGSGLSASERARQAVLQRVLQQQAEGTTDPSMLSLRSPSNVQLSALAVISKVLPNARPMGNLSVKSASIWPSLLEKGTWPDDYKLSDHGMVSVVFEGEVVLDCPV